MQPTPQNVLIVGSGGREHALGWALSRSPQAPQLFFAPGNPGCEALDNHKGIRLDLAVDNITGIVQFCTRERIELVVVGPEVPLSLGLGDALRAAGITVFGPNADGANIEASKAFAKQLMQEANVPTAHHVFCETEPDAFAALSQFSAPYVIKEDGLAAGKGVTIAATEKEARQAITAAFTKGMPVVIEEFMPGQELSVLAICDGKIALPLVGAQDFKKALDGNQGPNTGGMGAYAPVPFVTPALLQTVQTQVLDPMMAVFQRHGIDFRGVLYAGLMIGLDGSVSVVEFNCRFGDPETQVVLPLLNTDVLALLWAAAQGDLSAYVETGIPIHADRAAVTVVLTAPGYPGDYPKGAPVTLPETLSENLETNQLLFHAGTKRIPGGAVVTNGGRVLNATGIGRTLAEAREAAYAVAQEVTFDGMTYRRDIAQYAAQQSPKHAVATV